MKTKLACFQIHQLPKNRSNVEFAQQFENNLVYSCCLTVLSLIWLLFHFFTNLQVFKGLVRWAAWLGRFFPKLKDVCFAKREREKMFPTFCIDEHILHPFYLRNKFAKWPDTNFWTNKFCYSFVAQSKKNSLVFLSQTMIL